MLTISKKSRELTIGHKIDAIKANDKVSYCVYDAGYLSTT
jgi:hypothetical protein